MEILVELNREGSVYGWKRVGKRFEVNNIDNKNEWMKFEGALYDFLKKEKARWI